jgi:hypothetical protein
MKQKSLFKNLAAAAPPSAPPKSKAAKEVERLKAAAPNSPALPRRNAKWLPSISERIAVMNITAGNVGDYSEGIVEYVDVPNLYQDYMFPIQVWLPKLNIMVRVQLRDVRPLEEGK